MGNGSRIGDLRKRYLYFRVVGVVTLLVFLTSGCSNYGQSGQRYTAPPRGQEQYTPEQISPQADNLEVGSEGITSAAGKVIPTVVGILTTRVVQGRRTQSIGSGVIVDSTGYILTNNHVAGKDAEEIIVSLYDGREVDGTVVWTDPVLDLAVVKINADNLPVAVLGDSKNLKVGEQAIAIGNPLGLTFQRTVTAGIISALNRTIEIEEGVFMEDLIQTDASINPGNSGGPLINIRGEVIGINTIKVKTAEAMGFAVPINIVRPVVGRLRIDGKFTTPDMGLQAIDKELGRVYGFVADGGV